ncbi:MAG TPA: PqiC family protein [Candidatus Binataceae bacterium]|nr:PqiC family protein [Candidatus Binataceae bacterium]
MNLRLNILAIIAVALSSAVIGCGPVLAPQPDRSKFYTLTPVDAATSQPPLPIVLGLGPVNMPSYLDRNAVVIRTSPTEMDVSAVDRWAEPLSANFTRTLTEDLSRTLSPKQIVQFPWFTATLPDYQVEIYVYRFEANSAGTAVLSGRWAIRNPVTHKTLYSSDMNISQPVAKGDGAGAAALSKAVGQLSTEIAAAVRELPPPQQPAKTNQQS